MFQIVIYTTCSYPRRDNRAVRLNRLLAFSRMGIKLSCGVKLKKTKGFEI